LSKLQAFLALSKDERRRAVARLSNSDQVALAKALHEYSEALRFTMYDRMFPDTGPLRRELYPKHVEFFELGAWARARALIAGNGTGKTNAGAYETTAHVTGRYPHWWEGHSFDRPIPAWIGGDTTKTLRSITQKTLFGVDDYRSADIGSGMIPKSCIGTITPSNQLTGLIDKVEIRHTSGGWASVNFKPYDAGRDTWQGPNIPWIWLDEQSPIWVYEESITRIRGDASDGRIILTFTGLKGATDLALMFLPELSPSVDEKSMREASRARVQVSMDEVPHLSKEQVRMLLLNYTGMVRETRRTGIPYAGSGKVYTVDEESFVVKPSVIPKHFALISGADFGYGKQDNRDAEISGGTAAVWGAYDREQDIVYIFDEYFRAQAEAPVHATALKKHGNWVPCEGDYAGVAITEEGRGQVIKTYRKLGVDIRPANKDVEAGIMAVMERLSASTLRIFSTCQGLIQEIRMYSRDENGRIIKKNDHRLDALRYLVMGLRHAKTRPIARVTEQIPEQTFGLY
jgi:phage terminase large subunit-like protein